MLTCDCSVKCWKRWLSGNKLLLVTILAVLLGIILGLTLRNFEINTEGKIWIKLWGELFLRMLKAIILPLIMSCLITGIASMEGGASGRIGILTIVYVYTSHIVAVTLAVCVALAIRPGRWWEHSAEEVVTVDQDVNYTDMFTDFIRNLFPDNIVKACLQSAYTQVNAVIAIENSTNMTSETRKLLYRDSTNTLGIIVFSCAIGFSVGVCKDDGKPLLNVFKSLERVIFKLMMAILWYSPIGIISLIASALIEVESLTAILKSVGMYLLTVVISLSVHQFLLMPLVFFLIIRRNPFKYYFHLLEGILTAFAPPSSVAAMPGLFTALKDRLNVDSRVADFCLPILLTINRGGSAMFVAISALFIAQSYGMQLGIGAVSTVILLTSVLCPAVAAVPSSSLVILMTVCSAISVPLGDRLAVILALEWLQDRMRTTNNVVSTGYGCAIIERFCKGQLQTQDSAQDHQDEKISDTEESGSLLELNEKC